MKIIQHDLAFQAWMLALSLIFPLTASATPGSLGTAVTISGFQLQPPAGYAKINAPSPPTGSIVCAWVGARRLDGTHPTLEMMVMTIPLGQSARATLPFLSNNFLGGKKRMTANWRATSPQSVTIHCLRFYRTCWTGNDVRTGLLMQGVQYVARDGDKVILFASQDPTQDGTGSVTLAQDAMLTIRKAH